MPLSCERAGSFSGFVVVAALVLFVASEVLCLRLLLG